MLLAQISPVVVIAVAGILLFLMMVVLRFTLTLVRQVKALSATVREASEQLQDAAAGIRAESELASERLERLSERPQRRRKR